MFVLLICRNSLKMNEYSVFHFTNIFFESVLKESYVKHLKLVCL